MSQSNQKMTVEYDAETAELLEELKEFFGVKTKAAVIKRSLAIARAAKKYSDRDKNVQFVNPENTKMSKTFILR
jgi:hypothetical protein